MVFSGPDRDRLMKVVMLGEKRGGAIDSSDLEFCGSSSAIGRLVVADDVPSVQGVMKLIVCYLKCFW